MNREELLISLEISAKISGNRVRLSHRVLFAGVGNKDRNKDERTGSP